jgi:8-oxo-dGTP pyrophosphatase MutT (NUDIX family)
MEFFRNFFTTKKVSRPGAGCIFTDGNLILAGYQPKGPYISGIGGSSFDGEEPIVTAMREVMEELLGISGIFII